MTLHLDTLRGLAALLESDASDTSIRAYAARAPRAKSLPPILAALAESRARALTLTREELAAREALEARDRFNTREAAVYLDLSRDGLRHHLYNSGFLQAEKTDPARPNAPLHFSKTALDAFLALPDVSKPGRKAASPRRRSRPYHYSDPARRAERYRCDHED